MIPAFAAAILSACAVGSLVALAIAVAHNPYAYECANCRCPQSDHKREFGFGGACRYCAHCARFRA